VALLEKDGTIHFTVEDNGLGAGLGGPIREGNGLRGMRERVQSIAGAVKLTSSADRGTSLQITLPPAGESPAQAASRFVAEADTL
jgi:signal transduction histidine kinase